MQVTAVSCNQCGGSLEIPDSARFATCRYCGANLEIKRNESAVFTQVLEQINRNTADIAEDVEVIRLQNELERLDREWEMRRQQLLVHDDKGGTSVPSGASGALVAIIGGAGGIAFTVIAGSIAGRAGGPAVLVPIVGIGVTVIAIISGISIAAKGKTYEREEGEYQYRREGLVREIQNAAGSSR